MPYSLDIVLGEHCFRLLADHGLYWPDQQTLFVADTHLGKEATFRRHGIPVPRGSTDATLARIAHMLEQTHAKRLCILGDMFHARSSLSRDVRQSVETFFGGFPDLAWLLVRGNHDANVGTLPTDWPIEVIEPGIAIQKVRLGHHPLDRSNAPDVYLCGHLHPAARIRSVTESLGPFPCFWHSRGCFVLPAIGEFTGKYIVETSTKDSVWIVVDRQIHSLKTLTKSDGRS